MTQPRADLLIALTDARAAYLRPSPEWRALHRAERALMDGWWYIDAGNEARAGESFTTTLRDLAAVDLPAALRERLMTARGLR